MTYKKLKFKDAGRLVEVPVNKNIRVGIANETQSAVWDEFNILEIEQKTQMAGGGTFPSWSHYLNLSYHTANDGSVDIKLSENPDFMEKMVGLGLDETNFETYRVNANPQNVNTTKYHGGLFNPFTTVAQMQAVIDEGNYQTFEIEYFPTDSDTLQNISKTHITSIDNSTFGGGLTETPGELHLLGNVNHSKISGIQVKDGFYINGNGYIILENMNFHGNIDLVSNGGPLAVEIRNCDINGRIVAADNVSIYVKDSNMYYDGNTRNFVVSDMTANQPNIEIMNTNHVALQVQGDYVINTDNVLFHVVDIQGGSIATNFVRLNGKVYRQNMTDLLGITIEGVWVKAIDMLEYDIDGSQIEHPDLEVENGLDARQIRNLRQPEYYKLPAFDKAMSSIDDIDPLDSNTTLEVFRDSQGNILQVKLFAGVLFNIGTNIAINSGDSVDFMNVRYDTSIPLDVATYIQTVGLTRLTTTKLPLTWLSETWGSYQGEIQGYVKRSGNYFVVGFENMAGVTAYASAGAASINDVAIM